ncbi:hypothetical protein AN0438.2 [Aspergillus nidulans FGSC A4]|nr:hypothetical protein AN0438.2 [Aspergillus nidulans FGSC A4]|eukprot:XP_658042.1 hypothetical protein AN0438.2 [Aspergillus nidulans FGSC A4]
MHKPSLAQIVHRATFPRQRTSDPATFAAHIALNLVPEVRIETSTFYGSLDSVEAQYPGLDYSYGPHRMRLSRFPWHRKLFRVFDELGLTEAEISSLCRWEGTKSARQRYEKEEAEETEESSEEEMESCGVELHHRLLAATAARERGANVPLDEDWEQWLKEAGERGSYTDVLNAIRRGQPLNYLYDLPASISQAGRSSIPQSVSLSEPLDLLTSSRLFSTSNDIRPPPHSPARTAR